METQVNEMWRTKIKKLEGGKILINGGDRDRYYGAFWVAEIVGKDDDFEFEREFLKDSWEIDIKKDGIYEIFRSVCFSEDMEDYFIILERGHYDIIDKDTVIKLINKYYK